MSRSLTLFLSAAAFVVALTPVSVRAADEPKDIIAKAIKAHGGEELLTKNKAAQLKLKGTITLPGVGEVEFTQETAYMLPDKFRDNLELKIAGKSIAVFTLINGDKMTIEVDGKAVDLPADAKDATKNTMKEMGHVIDVARLVTLKDKGYELSIIGDDKVDGKKVIGVRVSKKDHKDVSLYFDKETGLLAKLEHRTVDQATGNEVTEERVPSGYEKNKDGLQVPKKVTVKRDGKAYLEAEVLEAKYFEKLDDADFKK